MIFCRDINSPSEISSSLPDDLLLSDYNVLRQYVPVPLWWNILFYAESWSDILEGQWQCDRKCAQRYSLSQAGTRQRSTPQQSGRGIDRCRWKVSLKKEHESVFIVTVGCWGGFSRRDASVIQPDAARRTNNTKMKTFVVTDIRH